MRNGFTIVLALVDCCPGTGCSCVALMGSTMSKTQEDLLADHFADVAVMLDGDDAGRTAAIEIVDRLQRRVYRVQFVDLPSSVQPDGLEEEQLRHLLARCR